MKSFIAVLLIIVIAITFWFAFVYEDEQYSPPNIPTITVGNNQIDITWEGGQSLQLKTNSDEILGISDVNLDSVSFRNPSLTGCPKLKKIGSGSHDIIGINGCQYDGHNINGNDVTIHSKLTTEDGDMDLDWVFTPWEFVVENNRYIYNKKEYGSDCYL